MAPKLKIVHDQGTTFRRTFTYLTNGATPTPVPLTDYTARMHLRAGYDDVVVLELTTENGRIEIDEDEGKIFLEVDSETMELIEDATYLYDLELVSSDVVPEVIRLVEGTFRIRPEVTKEAP